MDRPFLDDSFHIRWSRLTPDHVVPDIGAAIEAAQSRIDALAEDPEPEGGLTFENTLLELEAAMECLSRPWGRVGHLDSVCNSEALRAAYNEMLPKVSEFFSRVPLNLGLWRRLVAYSDTEEAKGLTGARKRYLEETLADFRNSGADLRDDRKNRLLEVDSALARATQEFSENVLDSTNLWELVVDDESKLDGLPGAAKAAARENAEAKGLGDGDAPKWRFTLQAPSFLPVLEHVHDDDLRRQVWEGTCTIGRGGDHDNTDLIWEILALRQEKAEILGKANFADHVLERRMAKTGATALGFVDDLFERTKQFFDRETAELEAYKAAKTESETGPLEPWEIPYWSERRRKEQYDFDAEELRPYFPIDGVIEGMFDLVSTIFGLDIRKPAGKPDVWNESVEFYEIRDRESATHLGSFYADWFPRETKRSGAWMHELHTGEHHADGSRSPHLGLVCGNLTPPLGDAPALLRHDEVETIFHEFGHLLHHLLGEVEVKSLNGVRVAWDFVELPSQIMQNFCWERISLDRFARHHETGAPIPEALFAKMRAARNYRSASAMMRQLSFAKLDLELHVNQARNPDPERNLDALTDRILEGLTIPTRTKVPTIARRFGHLFASPVGYGAGYYSYKWAEVLDADAFTRFLATGVLSPETGAEFREKILSKGNSEDPAKLFHDFMGRAPDPEALIIRSGLTT